MEHVGVVSHACTAKYSCVWQRFPLTFKTPWPTIGLMSNYIKPGTEAKLADAILAILIRENGRDSASSVLTNLREAGWKGLQDSHRVAEKLLESWALPFRRNTRATSWPARTSPCKRRKLKEIVMKSLLPLANRLSQAANTLAKTESTTALQRVSKLAQELESTLRVAYGKGLAQRRDVKAAHAVLLGLAK